MDKLKDMISKKELADYFSVSTVTIDNWVKKKGLIEINLGGGTIRYSKEDIIKFIEDGKA